MVEYKLFRRGRCRNAGEGAAGLSNQHASRMRSPIRNIRVIRGSPLTTYLNLRINFPKFPGTSFQNFRKMSGRLLSVIQN
jgi:hypothetical protein